MDDLKIQAQRVHRASSLLLIATIIRVLQPENQILFFSKEALGSILTIWALTKIASVQVHLKFSVAMILVVFVAFIYAFQGILVLVLPIPTFIENLFDIVPLFNLVNIAGAFLFCFAMSWLYTEWQVPESPKIWRITGWVFLILGFVPQSLLLLASAYSRYTLAELPFHGLWTFIILQLVLYIPYLALVLAIYATQYRLKSSDVMKLNRHAQQEILQKA